MEPLKLYQPTVNTSVPTSEVMKNLSATTSITQFQQQNIIFSVEKFFCFETDANFIILCKSFGIKISSKASRIVGNLIKLKNNFYMDNHLVKF